MAQAQYTPGPWHVGDRNMLLGTYIRDENGFCVAVANTPNNERACYIDEAANSRLIAAAPDLLATLELVDGYFAPDDGEEDIWCDIRATIQAAIAKALKQTD